MPANEQTVRLHVKILVEPTAFTIDQMVDGMREVFEPQGILVEIAGEERLNLPALEDVNVGPCTRGTVTPEQRQLFSHRNDAGPLDLCVYFVRSTVPPTSGCAAHPDGRPGAVVASGAPVWTLAHEIGHVLGLEHVPPTDRLMTRATAQITNPPPDLTPAEVKTMHDSPFTR
jgi:hypothetical protein